MKKKQKKGLPNSPRFGARILNQQDELANVKEKFEVLKLAAENLCRITENGEILWNEGVYMYFLEILGFRKVKIDGGEPIYVQKKENTMVEIDREQIVYYVLFFLNHIERSDISIFLLENSNFFSPNFLNMLKEEAPDEFFDEMIELYGKYGIVLIEQDKMFPGRLNIEKV